MISAPAEAERSTRSVVWVRHMLKKGRKTPSGQGLFRISTTTGEPILFSKAIFEIMDKDAVMKGIIGIKEFEQDKSGFVWLSKRDKEGSAMVLGNITIKDNKLVLECNSKKRLEKGKKIIIKHLSAAVVHKADTFQEPKQALKSYEGKPDKEKAENSP